MVGRTMLMSWTTGDKPTASITRFSKRSGSLPPISAEPHGSAGGSEPASVPSSAQKARNDSRRCASGSVGPCRGGGGGGALLRIRGSVSHTAWKLGGATSAALRWGEKRGDEAVEGEEVTSCERVEAVPGPRRVDELEQFLGVVGHERWSGPTVCEEEAQIGARCQRNLCGPR